MINDPPTGAASDPAPDVVEHLLDLARRQLEMDVAFIGQFTGGKEVLRWVAGQDDWKGAAVPLEQTYCHRVVQGQLPSVVQDAQRDERVRDLEATRTANIGAYVGVPIVFSDGQVFGTLCCVSHTPEPSLRDRDAKFLQFLASLVAEALEERERARAVRRQAVARIQACLDAGGPRMVFQAIVELGSRDVVGFEALARFYEEPLRPPNVWFDEAWAVGLGVALELAAVRSCPAQVGQVSASAYASLNVCPETLTSGELAGALSGLPTERIVIEVTEARPDRRLRAAPRGPPSTAGQRTPAGHRRRRCRLRKLPPHPQTPAGHHQTRRLAHGGDRRRRRPLRARLRPDCVCRAHRRDDRR